ncbi:MAG: isocitrate lyase/phosphoenolpyruvate mutase family protein [Alphaproteobacteria bacterium]|nr:isocitrate lyase/phosphoenolpyruvate mutase family protein [Alphaproteobacteria bacterium]MBO6862554.1 isocitrate lyase/phosphoenolpyruvate mutase family protein [Alphaproteobacteria bacterium]
MPQADKAQHFNTLHVKGNPVVLYNIWDAGSAKALAEAGAPAVATGSWSVAAAQGYPDGEALPRDVLTDIARRIAGAVDVPVTIDFEGGYAADPADVAANFAALLDTGIVGVNFEDRVVGGDGLHPIAAQADRIAALRRAADAKGVPAFLNARTDLFLREKDKSRHAALIPEALERAQAYAAAGASGFFVPGLTDAEGISEICAASPLPVNVMKMGDAPDIPALSALGVGRVSFGPAPYIRAMADLADRFRTETGTQPH